ncbi:arabinose isomerase [Sphingobacterium sp. JB170]|uniref:arabinose isomerase n=1 Tax=Sphingobacterium sp. JB170 TaxID=1434842 RepID=UPI00097EEE85|nr:arabinose isomerase [Sphingobacterium sp. JB170]SJN47781.1 putative L-arabinose isomerase [Sphingobacterium sp. JB170]
MAYKQQLHVGILGIGLEAYWEQFDGLKALLETDLEVVSARIGGFSANCLNFGLVDNVDRAFQVGSLCRSKEIDLVFVHCSTYSLSATLLPILQRAKVPVIILNLSPQGAIDYQNFNKLSSRRAMTGQWLRFCGACPVPEIANLMSRLGMPFYEVTGLLDENDPCWQQVSEWIAAAIVVKTMASNRMGAIGTYYSGMLDIYTDLTKQLGTFGGHIEILPIDELTAIRKQITPELAQARVEEFYRQFDIRPDCEKDELTRAAYTSIALDQLVETYQLGSIAYYHKGVPQTENEDTITSIILGTSLLTARGIPVAGEYEIKNAQAMKIMDALGAGGSFTEYYALDYQDDVVLMGHDGPGHIKIANGKTKVRPLEVYHGKVGKGLAVEMQVKIGPVTLLSVVENAGGELMLLFAQGESVKGPILEIGNTNSRYRFAIGARNFAQQWNSHGPAHHCAVGLGLQGSKIEKIAKLLGIRSVKVC